MLPRNSNLILLIVILALAAFFRFYLITEIPPGLYPDEAANGNNALEALRAGSFKIFYPENNGREGLFINLQAISIKLLGAEPWALRLVSAIIGTLTILGIYLLAKELFKNQESGIRNHDSKFMIHYSTLTALLSAFFLATSYWHINFSRIGFRAIMVPFFAVFGMYWLLKALRTGKISGAVFAGIAAGLGFYTYIAFRFMPLVLAVPILFSLRRWWKGIDANIRMNANDTNPLPPNPYLPRSIRNSGLLRGPLIPRHCIPCIIALFLLVTFLTALPIGLYFLQNPQDFFGRGGQVSIFTAESPAYEFVKSTVLTLGMFNIWGDCNQRHNFNCAPELFWPVGILFAIGLILTVRNAFAGAQKSEIRSTKSETDRHAVILRSEATKEPPEILRPAFSGTQDDASRHFEFRISSWILLAWFLFLMFPATLTREGLPHALRSIGMIPPVMILAAIGGVWLWQKITAFFDQALANPKYQQFRNQILRIKKEVAIAAILLLILIPINTYRDYFVRFAYAEKTSGAFAQDLWQQGRYLARLPPDIKKIVIVNLSGDDIRRVPAPTQTIMFATDTFDEIRRKAKGLSYITRLDEISIGPDEKVVILAMNPHDQALRQALRSRYPELEERQRGSFLILANYP